MNDPIHKYSIRTVVNHCIRAAQELSDEPMYGKPTDIIGFSEMGQKLAAELEKIVGIREICYYDTEPVSSKYHYLDFKDMLKLTEYMFITCPAAPEYLKLFDNLSDLNPNCKVIIASSGFENVAQKIAKIVGQESIRTIDIPNY